jgi:predicted CoA-substrate-specific enzyme activase
MYLGIDIGSVSTNLAVVDDEKQVVDTLYLRTGGAPIRTVKEGLNIMRERLPHGSQIKGTGTTGSARHLIGVLLGADVIKNEIIAHASGTVEFIPDVGTIIEIGGQDSKIILLDDGVPVDFNMNTICAAGTGSFLDHQAQRLGIPIEEFGDYALRSGVKVNIAGRCTVFAESDMIHKQQLGLSKEDIINGLCQAIVRNYLNNVAKGKKILPPVAFQGGVASNKGVVRAFETQLGVRVIVPPYHDVMGAIGIAVLAKEQAEKTGDFTPFRFEMAQLDFKTRCFECQECPNLCEIVEIIRDGELLDRSGSRCGKWAVRDTKELAPVGA